MGSLAPHVVLSVVCAAADPVFALQIRQISPGGSAQLRCLLLHAFNIQGLLSSRELPLSLISPAALWL